METVNKYALVTLSDSKFMTPTYVMIKSFLKHNQWFKGDVVIIIYEEIQEEKKIAFLNLYDKVKFYEPDTEKYNNAVERFSSDFSENVPICGMWPFLLKLEAFGLEEYDRVVFYDSDMLFVGDIKDAFFNDYGFCICEDRTTRPPFYKNDKRYRQPLFNLELGITKYDGRSYLNSGFYSIKNPNKDYLKELIKIAENYEVDGKFYTGDCIDQDVINTFLKDKDTYVFGIEYNALQCHYDEKYGRKLTTEKAIHYFTHMKPWRGDYDERYKYIHDIWRKEYNEINEDIRKIL